MRESVAGLIPNASSPISASPLSFSSTRLNFSAAATSGCFFGLGAFIPFGLVDLILHFGGEVTDFFFDSFTHDVQRKRGDRRALGPQQRFYRLLPARILHERLLQQG